MRKRARAFSLGFTSIFNQEIFAGNFSPLQTHLERPLTLRCPNPSGKEVYWWTRNSTLARYLLGLLPVGLEPAEARCKPMAKKVFEIRSIYLASRHKEVRCRLWYEVTPLRDGLVRHFLVGIEELD